MTAMFKRCKICGKPFMARQSNYVCCSDKCRKVNAKLYKRTHPTTKRYDKYVKIHYVCPVCGSDEERHKRGTVCNACLIRELKKSWKGDRATQVKHLLHCRGYDKELMLEEIEMLEVE